MNFTHECLIAVCVLWTPHKMSTICESACWRYLPNYLKQIVPYGFSMLVMTYWIPQQSESCWAYQHSTSKDSDLAWSEVPTELTRIWIYTQTARSAPPSHSLSLSLSLSNHRLKFNSIDHRRMNYEGVWRSWRLRLVRGSLQKNAPAQRHLQVGREWWIGGLGESWWKSLTFIERQSVFSIKPSSFVSERENEKCSVLNP